MQRDPAPTALIAALLVVALAVIGGMVLLIAARPAPVSITINPPPPTPEPPATLTPAPIVIYVTGAVSQPGSVVNLPPGSRVQDALLAAGGAAANADLERLDMAALLHDGETIHVYTQGEASQPSAPQSAPDASGGIVHVNRATQAELETLPGIGPALAQRIIDYRTANGAFASLQELTEVSGIGERTIEALEGLVAFD
jgi:competence protein ComEA